MVPRPDVAWTDAMLTGNWHGMLTAPKAEGRLEVHGLKIAGNTQIPRLNAELAARDGKLLVEWELDGLEIPGPSCDCRQGSSDDPCALKLDAAARPLELTATHSLFKLRASAETAGANGAEQHATLALTVLDLSPFADSAV